MVFNFLEVVMRNLVISVLCAWSVAVLAIPQSVDDLKRTPDALYFSGYTFLSTFPYEPVPYDDYVVDVVYYELPAESLLVIEFGGEADDFFVLHKRLLVGSESLKFFVLTEAQTSEKVGFGSCSYDKESGKQTACEYTFEVGKVSFAWASTSTIRVTVEFVANSRGYYTFDSYILGNTNNGYRVKTDLEEPEQE